MKLRQVGVRGIQQLRLECPHIIRAQAEFGQLESQQLEFAALRSQLGARVRELRQARGLSQEALAFDAGIHVNHLSSLERGEANPSFLVLLSLAKVLGEQANYEVRTALNGFQAGLEAERFKPHVVLLDIHLGEQDVRNVAEQIHKDDDLQLTKVIGMSGKLTDGQLQALKTQGFDGFLKKPFQVRQVVEAIEAATNLVH